MELMKLKYKNVPGKQSVFEVIIVWATYGIILATILIYGIMIYDISRNHWNSQFITKSNNSSILYWILTLCILNVMFAPAYLYFIFKDIYMKNLKGEKASRLNNFLFFYLKGSKLISFIGFLAMASIVILSKSYKNIYDIFNYLTLTSLISFIILLSYDEILKINESKKRYCIYTNKQIIDCKCFLEYSDYYLVILNGVETYIKKSSVEKIEKR